jgi:DNA-binding NtrC family response regulator
MNDELLVLLVHDQEEDFRTLERTLNNLGIRTQRVHTCSEAGAALREPRSSRLILTATTLADGTWADVLILASLPGKAIPVIVVSRVVDVDLYLRTLESGASDFIVPPFSAADLGYLVHTAIAKSRAASA